METNVPIDWDARLKASMEDFARRKAKKAAMREEFAATRRRSLERRHAAKLARIRQQGETT